MKPMYLKELKQWWKLAAGGSALFMFAQYFLLMRTNSLNNQFLEIKDLLYSHYQLTMGLMAIAAGLCLGLVQTYPESERDKWAFLVFRPVSRTSIFWSKSLAGLTLFGLWVVIPWLLAVFWSSLPGSVYMPFDMLVMRIGLLDVLNGSIAYFAGWVISFRKGSSWIGSRIWPLLGSCLIMIFGNSPVEFQWALVLLLTGLVFSIFSAHGVFLEPEMNSYRPRLAQVALATQMTSGCFVTIALLLVFSKLLVHKTRNRGQYATYQFLNDGRLYIATYSNGTVTNVIDLDNKPFLTKGPEPFSVNVAKQILPGASSDFTHFQNAKARSSVRDPQEYVRFLGNAYSARTLMIMEHQTEVWMYSYAKGRFFGYDRKTKKLLGSLGPSGFIESGKGWENSDRFGTSNQNEMLLTRWTQPGLSESLLMDGNRLYLVHPNERKIEAYNDLGANARAKAGVVVEGASGSIVVVNTGTDLWIHEFGNPNRVQIPLSESLRSHTSWMIAWRQSGETRRLHILSGTKNFYEPDSKLEVNIYEWEKDNPASTIKLEESRAVPPILQMPASSSWVDDMIATVFPVVLVHPELLKGRLSAVTSKWTFWSCITVTLIAVVITVRLLYFNRRFSNRRQDLLWIVWVTLTGVAGLVAFWVMSRGHETTPCRHCSQSTRVNEHECQHCSGELSSSTQDGTEILEVAST